MKLQNTSHTSKGKCMPKLTIASLGCTNLSCCRGYRVEPRAQLGASTLIQSTASREAPDTAVCIKQPHAEQEAPSGQATGLTHRFPLFAPGQTPHAFKLFSVWKANAAEASHLFPVLD